MNEQLINKKYNVKLFPIYKAFAWDLLFYYAVSFLFLTTVKGISASSVLLLDAFYPVFKFLLQIPCTLIVNKYGNRKSLLIGNILVSGSILIIILANNFPMLVFSQFLSAFGYILKNLTESAFLFDSIEKNEQRNDKFSKIDGRSSSLYYYIDASTSLITGYLFLVNGYLPMVLCFIFCIVSTLMSYSFKEVVSSSNKNKIRIRDNLNDIRDGFKFVFQSKRLKSLLLCSAVLTSILAVRSSLSSSIFTDIHLPEQYFGIFYAIFQVLSGIASNKQEWFHHKYRNKTLTVFGLTITFSMIGIGLCKIIGLNYNLTLAIILIMLSLQCTIKGPYYTLMKRYLNSFSTSSMRTKIYAADDLLCCIFRTITCLVCSALLDITTTSYVYIILGCIFTVFLIFLLDHMKHTVGLKPEEYSESDINFVQTH